MNQSPEVFGLVQVGSVTRGSTTCHSEALDGNPPPAISDQRSARHHKPCMDAGIAWRRHCRCGGDYNCCYRR